MKCTYFLCVDQGRIFSTDSYTLYLMYLRMFNPEEYEKVMYPSKSRVRFRSGPEQIDRPITSCTFKNALAEEQRVYDCGYVPVVERHADKYGKLWYRTVWREKEEVSE